MEVDADHDNFGGDHDLRLRQANWFIADEKLGRLTVGQGSPATDDITIINLGARMSDAALHYNNSFALQFSPNGNAPNPVFEVKWGDLAHTIDTMRGNFVRYDSPTMKGFLLSAAAGEDDIWDVALRYADGPEWLRIAGGIGFMDNRELGIRDLGAPSRPCIRRRASTRRWPAVCAMTTAPRWIRRERLFLLRAARLEHARSALGQDHALCRAWALQ